MKKNIRNYFEQKKQEKLDLKTREFLYKNIQQRIKHQFGIKKTIFYRSKLVSIALIFALGLGSFMSYFNSPNVAVADYVANIVSWDGTYHITFNNEVIDHIKTDNQIPDGGSIVLAKGSKMSVKTDNNATADIIGPAKLTFQKSNNQLIVDIAYSDHVDIKNSTILSESKDQDILIVKTDNKTIVAKTDVIDISLNNLGSQQMIKNNAGEISITSLSDNSVLALKSNESVLLNEEKTLFALEDKKNITLNEKENTVSKSDEAKEAQLIEITLETTILNEGLLNEIDDNQKNTTITELGDTSQTSLSGEGKNNESEELKQENDEIDSIQNIKESTNIETQISIDGLLDSKLVLNSDVVALLDGLYKEYHFVHKKDITKVSTYIVKLCDALELVCNEKELKDALIMINKKIINNYIMTKDIKLVY